MAKYRFPDIIEVMKIPTNLNAYRLFSALGIFILGLEFLAIILALLGVFYWPILAVYLFGTGTYLGLLFFKNCPKINPHSLYSGVLVAFFVVLALVFFSFSAEPSVFSGRDQGSFSEAATRLAQNHKLTFESDASREFFKIYGPGTALNFPGFNYTKTGQLITHFSVGYIAWLAVFYAFFGLAGFFVANGVLFFLFALSFFALIKLFSNERSAWSGIFFVLSTFVFSWFFKLTLSENLALGFVWFGALEFSLFLKYRDNFFLIVALVTFLLLTFTRIEAWALLFMLGIALRIFQEKKKDLFSKSEWKTILRFGGIFLLTLMTNLWINSQFYRASIKGLLNSFSPKENASDILETLSYLFQIFCYYDFLVFLIIGALGIIYFASRKKYLLLAPFILFLPIFIYLIHPGISLDHPWMLRRFIFAIIPLGIFYTTLLVDRLLIKKVYFFLSVLFLLTANLIFSVPLFSFSENKNLLLQTKNIGENFSATDLVLIDRLSSGDGWSMLGGPLSALFGKQAVYFFNPGDLAKIETSRFTNVYLIIPDASLAFYEKTPFWEKLIPQRDYQLSRTRLAVPDLAKSTYFPQKSEMVTEGKIYLLKK